VADDDEQTDEQQTDEQTDQQSDQQSDEQGSDDSAAEVAENDDPSFGKKDDEPVNDVQMKYLEPLAEKMDEEIPDDMSEADATDKINEMQENASG
jgi:hypothetical protein